MKIISRVGTDLLKFKISLEKINEILGQEGKLTYEYNDNTGRRIYEYMNGNIDILIKDNYGLAAITFNNMTNVEIWSLKGSELKKLDERLLQEFLKSKSIAYKVGKDMMGDICIYVDESVIIGFYESMIDYIQVYDPEYKVLD